MLRSCVAKRVTTTTFVVEPTNYGWSVGCGATRVGLFMTQRQALDAVKKCRAELTAKGQRSTVVVRASDPRISANRSPRSYSFRR